MKSNEPGPEQLRKTPRQASAKALREVIEAGASAMLQSSWSSGPPMNL